MLSAPANIRRRGGLPAQRGFSLIELLVTVVVFSVGLLAVAGLQAVSKQANFESMQRSTASQVAYGLLEDMRLNGGGLDVYVNGPDFGDGTIGTEPLPDCSSLASACSPAERAIHDMWTWEEIIDGAAEVGAGRETGGIVQPTICITGPVAGEAGIYSVAIAWRGSVALSDPQGSACGAASGKYGASNRYRRVLQVDTFLDPAI